MDIRESNNIIVAILILTLVSSFRFLLDGNWKILPEILLYSIIIIALAVFVKKYTAYLLDADVEHEIWTMNRYGLAESWHFKGNIHIGIYLPLILSVISLGFLKVPTLLTYETRARKSRAAKRFGHYSYVEMTDWHNALIGSAGILAILISSTLGYIFGFEYFARIAAIYAFFSIVPFSNLDGMQIFFGSKTLWTVMTIICTIFIAYALFLV